MTQSEVIVGDFACVAKRWDTGAFATVVTDPPYGVTGHEWDRTGLRQEWLDEMLRVSVGPVLAFGAARPDAIATTLDLSPRPERIIVWRITSLRRSLGSGLFWTWQPIYVWRHRGLGPGWDTVSYPVEGRARGGHEHPTQKPVALMEDLLRRCPIGPVLDPFCGSGTTLVAGRRVGRTVVGVEVDPDMAEVALRRLKAGSGRVGLFTNQTERTK